ncbi:MAG: hypothetical protein IT183_01260 [Acidobacteria bacterium]|nr:hypothetical protein [Acidobacteriota bacterium]
MATHSTDHFDEAALMVRPTEQIGQLGSKSLLLGGAGVLLAAVGFFVARETFIQSYLIGYIFWVSLTLGALGVLMVHHLSGGAWGMAGRRVWEAATRTLPLMAVLFLPIAFNLEALYSWARPEAADDHVIHLKAAYLNAPFFYARAVLFFAIWGALVFLLNKWSREQDEQPAQLIGPQDRRFRLLSAPGLCLFVLTVTFMSVDWVMSLDPHWYSTIFGVLMIGGQGLATMAFTILVLAALVKFEPMNRVAHADVFHDLGKLMFAFTMLWTYFAVSQLLIIWSANLPEEVPFYLERLNGPWRPVSIALLLLQFVLPFLFLLWRDLKRKPQVVKWVALTILIMRVVDITWTIGPVFRHHGSTLHWLDFALVLAMGLPWLAVFWRSLAGRPLVPARDPYYKEAMAHVGH